MNSNSSGRSSQPGDSVENTAPKLPEGLEPVALPPDLEALMPEPVRAFRDKGTFTLAESFFTADDVRGLMLAATALERKATLAIIAELREHFSDYKDTALLNGDVDLSNAASGEPRACDAIAAAIRGDRGQTS